jgi:hypothetical protein
MIWGLGRFVIGAFWGWDVLGGTLQYVVGHFVVGTRVGTKINFREIFAKMRTKIIFVFRENYPRKCENFAFRENGF